MLESSPAERDLRVLVDSKLDASQQHAQPCPGGHQAQRCHRTRGGPVPSALQCAASLPALCAGWAPQYMGIKLLESIQRRAMERGKGL